MGILRSDRITGLGGANAIKGSVLFSDKQYFLIDNHEDFQFGTGDWTIEYWWNGHPNGGYNSVITTMITSNESGTWRVGHTFSGNNRIYFARGTGSGFTDVTFDVDVNDNKWHHIAFVRSSGTIIPFVDGVDKTATKATGSVSDGNNMTTTNRVIIGFNDRDNDHIHGHVSNLRVIKGTALYTSNFTPPTGELQKLSGTSLLCFQSPGNILQEETGKILQPFRDGSSAGDQSGSNSTFAVATRFTPHSPSTFTQYVDQGTNFGSTFDGVTTFDSQAYMVPPGSITRDRYPKSSGDIVSGNLIFHLDGGDSKSYAGVTTSGSIIYDLKEGTNSTGVGIATMTTGHSDFERVTWVPDNRGCFRQSSDSDFGTITGNRIEFPQISLGNDNYTINVWVKLNSLADGGDEIMYVISNKDGGPVSFHGHLRMNNGFARIGAGAYYSSWTYRYSTTTGIGPGQWHLLTWVNTAQYTGSMYVDGVLQTLDDGNTTWNSRTSNNTPLNSTAYAGGETFDGWIGQIQFYSDTLSETEILQNYNAHKCRYIY